MEYKYNYKSLKKTGAFFYLIFFLSMFLSFYDGIGQTILFTETMGSVAGTTTINNHESNNGFDNDPFTMTGTGDVRNTIASTGYSGASGLANIFLTNTANKNFIISGINTSGFLNLELKFGIFKNTNASTGSDLIVQVSTDGSTYTSLTYTPLPAGSGTAIWYQRTISAGIPASSTLFLQFTQTGNINQYRIDDISMSYIPCISSTWYQDSDNDGFGNNAISQLACLQPSGYVTDNTDCNDSNNNIHPGHAEVCDLLDNDCNGQTDEGVQLVFYKDFDGDGFGDLANDTLACTVPSGYSSDSTDCNDQNSAIHNPPVVSFTGLPLIKCDSTPVTLSGSPSGGTFSGTGVMGNTFTPTTSGTYTITYSYTTSGCTGTISQQVVVRLVNISGNSPVCAGNTLSLTASDGDAFAWTGPNGFSSSANPAAKNNMSVGDSGVYTVSVNITGCSSSIVLSKNITVTPVPFVDFSGLNPEYCLNEPSDILTGLPVGGTFSGSAISGNSFNPNTAGTISVTYTSSPYFGCPSQSVNKQTTVHALPVVSVSSSEGNILCRSESTTLTANSTAANFLWNTGSGSDTTIVNSAGSYSVIVTNSNNCSFTSAPFTISIDTIPVVYSSEGNSICQGDATTLSYFTNSTLWSTGATVTSVAVTPTSTTKYYVQGTSVNGCAYNDSITITVNPFSPPGAVTNMLPVDNTQDLLIPVNLSWFPGSLNTKYDVYVWLDNMPVPASPFASNVMGINYSVSQGLIYGGNYSWRVVSKNGDCFSTAGPIQHFKLRYLPDLTVQNIQFPPTATAGQSITINWDILNTGSGATGIQQWNDAIFLSQDTILDFEEAIHPSGLFGGYIYISGVPNLSALLPGQSYNNSVTYSLPINAAGTYYVFIITNAFHQLLESDSSSTRFWTSPSNNIVYSAGVLSVTVPPLPDLRVTAIINQNYAFSGDTIDVTYTIKNFGNGTTGFNSFWHEGAYVTEQPFLNQNSSQAGPIIRDVCGFRLENNYSNSFSAIHVGNLLPDSSYTNRIKVVLPKHVFGLFNIFIKTNVGNSLYEGPFGNNNLNSNPIQIFLKPPPDFVVSNISIPATASNGQAVTVSWTVTNQGGGPSNDLGYDFGISHHVWFDNAYLADNPFYDLANAIVVSNYDENQTAGNTSIFGSNHFNGLIDFCACDHYPADPITDVFFTFTCDGLRNQPLFPGESYTVTKQFNIPDSSSGTLFLYVETDSQHEIFEYNKENNNVLLCDSSSGSSGSIMVLNPDLQVTNVTIPSAANAGSQVVIHWQIKNNGPGSIFNRNRKDFIFLSADTIFNLNNDILIDSIGFTESISSTATINKQKSIILPNNLNGNYYVFVYTDFSNKIFEKANENNNINTSIPVIQINLTAWADLSVSSFNSNDSLETIVPFNLSYSVFNSGAFAANGSWVDRLYISKKSSWDADSSALIDSFPQTRFVGASGSYTINNQISIPQTQRIPNGTDSSKYYFYLITDAQNSIFENTGEGNNIFRSAPIFIYNDYVDHIVINVQGADSVSSGLPYDISWTVKNIGSILNSNYYSVWTDEFYLSLDTILDPSDTLFGIIVMSNPLATNNTYSNQHNYNIPNGISGNYYLIGSTALRNEIAGEKKRNNNYNFIRNTNATARTIHINATPSPDLKVTLMNAPARGIAGQPIDLKFTVKNDGLGITIPGQWQDVVHLSSDFIPGNGDAILNISQSQNTLNPGQSYSDSIRIFLPAQSTGNNVLILRTDNTDAVYEPDNSNNSGFSLITITNPPPSDLVVRYIIIPDSAVTGDPVSISWSIVNNGFDPASGFTREGVYFSVDSIWDIDDPLLGTADNVVNISPGSSVTHSLTAILKSTAVGYHYVIIRADLLDNLPETNENNNITASIDRVFVTVKNLPLSIVTQDVLLNNEFLYYRFDAVDSLSGQTLLITLKGDSVNGINEIYSSFEKVPTRFDFDFSFTNPVSGNQELIVPALDSGVYYFTIFGHSNTTSQQITLLAEILPFAIRSVNSNKGGNTGNVTVRIAGSKFTPSMRAHLISNTSSLDISSVNVNYINSTTVFATFNLNQKPLGVYDVKLIKPDSSVAILDDGFEIELGSSGSFYVGGISNGGMTGDPSSPGCNPGASGGINQGLQVSVNAPAFVNLGRIIPMQITFGNAGNVDMPVPTRILVCNVALPLASTIPELGLNKHELYLEFREPGGPTNILRAGATATLTVFSKATISGFHLKATFTLK